MRKIIIGAGVAVGLGLYFWSGQTHKTDLRQETYHQEFNRREAELDKDFAGGKGKKELAQDKAKYAARAKDAQGKLDAIDAEQKEQAEQDKKDRAEIAAAMKEMEAKEKAAQDKKK